MVRKLKKPESPRKPLSPEIAKLQEYFDLMARNGIVELEWETKGSRFKARSGLASTSEVVSVAPAVPTTVRPDIQAAATSPKSEASASSQLPANRKQITSPFVGTFYRAPSPSADVYVREGQQVKKGDTLCIIEAMKLMNALESEVTGKIVSILVENGQPVEFGEPLFVVET